MKINEIITEADMSRRGFLRGMGAAAATAVGVNSRAEETKFDKIGSWTIVTTSSKFTGTSKVAFAQGSGSLIYDGESLRYTYKMDGETIIPSHIAKFILDNGPVRSVAVRGDGYMDLTRFIDDFSKAKKVEFYIRIKSWRYGETTTEPALHINGLANVIRYFKNR
jgi:hypothetical protein